MLAINNEKGDRRNEKNYESDYKWLQFKLLWIPVIGPKIRKELNKIGWNAYFPPAVNWKSILCNKKRNLLPNSYRDVYQTGCNYAEQYTRETKKIVVTRSMDTSMAGQSKSSGFMDSLNCCILTKLQNFEKEKHASFNLEVKGEFNDTIKGLNHYRWNIVNIKFFEIFVPWDQFNDII